VISDFPKCGLAHSMSNFTTCLKTDRLRVAATSQRMIQAPEFADQSVRLGHHEFAATLTSLRRNRPSSKLTCPYTLR
jgi:hypothetical protein